MANVTGTAGADFIHLAGDGQNPGGLNEITTVTAGNDVISAGAGSDVVFADAGNDTVNGDDGNDTLTGGQGTDRVLGGVGNDFFRMQGVSDISGLAETVNGGNDLDTLDFQTFSAVGAVDLSAATLSSLEQLFLVSNDVTLTAAQLGAFTLIAGTGLTERLILSGAGLADLTGATLTAIDVIRGNELDNAVHLNGVMQGQALELLNGNDSLQGSNAGDTANGSEGEDTLRGRHGNDSLFGGVDNDLLDGGSENDVLTGGEGVDVQTGSTGNDTFRVNVGAEISGLAESISGDGGVDTLDFRTGLATGPVDLTAAVIASVEQLLLGGTELTLRANQLSAFDLIQGSGFLERLILSGTGTADLTGATIEFIEEIRGSNGRNTILLTDVIAGQFVDGRGGNDSIAGGLGADRIVGGFGEDTIEGSEGADTLTGGQDADSISGGIGNDLILISGVSDVSGLAETIDGGNDNDTLNFSQLAATGDVDLSAATLVSIENLVISNNTVTMTGAQLSGFDTIFGSGFVEIIRLSTTGVVDLSGASISFIELIEGTVGDDTLLYTNGTTAQSFAGGEGNDSLVGGLANDTLAGDAGDDTLSGGNGNDRLTGGLGRDLLTGGFGLDTFDFNDLSELGLGAARDRITDFTHGDDVIDLADLDANSETVGNQAFTFIGAGPFNNVAGELQYAGGVLSMDINGDGTADRQIILTGSPVLTISDFLL